MLLLCEKESADCHLWDQRPRNIEMVWSLDVQFLWHSFNVHKFCDGETDRRGATNTCQADTYLLLALHSQTVKINKIWVTVTTVVKLTLHIKTLSTSQPAADVKRLSSVRFTGAGLGTDQDRVKNWTADGRMNYRPFGLTTQHSINSTRNTARIYIHDGNFRRYLLKPCVPTSDGGEHLVTMSSAISHYWFMLLYN